MRGFLIALMIASVALAGCAGGDEVPTDTSEVVDKDTFQLAAGKGAIAGLLVDDRFRPIDLEDSPATESQFTGFVLLQETGEQVQTNEDGEFTFVDLEPGTYTIRVSVSGHEATPQKVRVEIGEFTEVSSVARRILSDSGTIISTEFAAFVPCGANLIAYGTSFDCTFDQSGDSSRESFTVNFTGYDARHVVMEMRANSPQYFDVWLQAPGNEVCSGAYQIMGGPDTTYLRWQLDLGQKAVSSDTASGAGCETTAWNNTAPLQTVVYLNSLGFDQGIGFGIGAYIGVQANFVMNVFLGETETNVDAYCVYC